MMYIALHEKDDKKVALLEIARDQNIPPHFLSKILQLLVKYEYLGSMKGKNGGFYLMKPARKINLLHVVDVFDGMKIWERCSIGLHACSDKNPCPVHKQFKKIKADMKQSLMEKSLSDLCDELRDKKSILAINDGLKKVRRVA